MPQMKNIVTVMSPLKQGDCLVIGSEHTGRFMSSIHCHDVFELHLIQGATGAKRIVGDRVALIGDLELVLLAQSHLPHAWLKGRCQNEEHLVVTVYFRPDLFGGLADKTCFGAVEHMFELAASGLVFSQEMTKSVYQDLLSLAAMTDRLQQYLLFVDLLNRLASDKEAQRIVGPGYVRDTNSQDNHDIATVKNYIYEHYTEDIYLKDLADLVGVEEQWISALFRERTGSTVSAYINQVRLGQVSKRLMKTEDLVAQIAVECGYGNLANFNRHFKRWKGTTPLAFRREYRTSGSRG